MHAYLLFCQFALNLAMWNCWLGELELRLVLQAESERRKWFGVIHGLFLCSLFFHSLSTSYTIFVLSTDSLSSVRCRCVCFRPVTLDVASKRYAQTRYTCLKIESLDQDDMQSVLCTVTTDLDVYQLQWRCSPRSVYHRHHHHLWMLFLLHLYAKFNVSFLLFVLMTQHPHIARCMQCTQTLSIDFWPSMDGYACMDAI